MQLEIKFIISFEVISYIQVFKPSQTDLGQDNHFDSNYPDSNYPATFIIATLSSNTDHDPENRSCDKNFGQCYFSVRLPDKWH